MTRYADSAAFFFFLNYSLYYKYSLVVCYLLASFSENIDGDWLLRISASFLLIKVKEKIKLQSRKSYVLLCLPPVSRGLLESHASFFPRESLFSYWFTGGFDCSCEWPHVNM